MPLLLIEYVEEQALFSENQCTHYNNFGLHFKVVTYIPGMQTAMFALIGYSGP